MLKKTLFIAFRYFLPLAAFALTLLLTELFERLFGISLDLTSLIIVLMIATAWYLGTAPGLLVALIFELTIDYFSPPQYTLKSAFIIFNRMVLFVSLVWFAGSRRRAEKLLRDGREWLQVTLSSIGDAVIATDISGKIIFINPTAENLTGWTKTDALNQTLEDVFQIVNEDTHLPVASPFAAVVREGAIVGLANHTILKTKTGAQIPIEDSGAPIKDDAGEIIGVIVVFHDVSQRRRAERERALLLTSEQHARAEAEEAARVKDEFLATVSHELRTPLNAILGWAAMLNNAKLDAAATENALQVIERNARAQAEIINDILDVSRIITGKLNLDTATIRLAPVIQSAIDTIRPAAAAKAVTLKSSLAGENDAVFGDRDRLQQIFWNLVSNAVKFTPHGGWVEIESRQTESHLEITVADSGIGIAPEFLPHIFERFRQADSSTTRMHGGLGLGLAIVRHLVELHGGTVTAASAGENQGAIFTVRLPAAPEREQPTASAQNVSAYSDRTSVGEPANSKIDLTGVRVLLVDDEPDTLEILGLALNNCGAEVRTTDSTAAALAAFHQWQPDVLVSDLGMPEQDGYDLIRQIRALAPDQGGNTPSAALTAYVRAEDRTNALAAGYQTHLAKPVDPHQLAAAVLKLSKRTKQPN